MPSSSSSSASSSSAPAVSTNSRSKTVRRRSRVNSDSEPAAAAAAASNRKRSSRVASSEAQGSTDERKRARRGNSSASEAASASPVSKSKPSKSKSSQPETSPLDIQNCGICFEESFKYAGVLDCCKHGYCYDCIVKWASENSNTCPQCKRRIESIMKTEVATGKRIGRAKKIKHRDLSSNQGLSGGLLVTGPNFFQTIFGLYGMSDHEVFYQLLLNGFGMVDDDDDEEEDDEDWVDYENPNYYDISDGPEDVCAYCGSTFPEGLFQFCPECDNPLDSDNMSESSGASGTRENPIELD